MENRKANVRRTAPQRPWASLTGREAQGLQSPAGSPEQGRKRKRTAGPPRKKKGNLLDVGSSRLLEKSVQAYGYFLKREFYDSSLQNSKAFLELW